MSEDIGISDMAGGSFIAMVLAATGATVMWAAVAGAAVVLVGAILFRVARRRKTPVRGSEVY